MKVKKKRREVKLNKSKPLKVTCSSQETRCGVKENNINDITGMHPAKFIA